MKQFPCKPTWAPALRTASGGLAGAWAGAAAGTDHSGNPQRGGESTFPLSRAVMEGCGEIGEHGRAAVPCHCPAAGLGCSRGGRPILPTAALSHNRIREKLQERPAVGSLVPSQELAGARWGGPANCYRAPNAPPAFCCSEPTRISHGPEAPSQPQAKESPCLASPTQCQDSPRALPGAATPLPPPTYVGTRHSEGRDATGQPPYMPEGWAPSELGAPVPSLPQRDTLTR